VQAHEQGGVVTEVVPTAARTTDVLSDAALIQAVRDGDIAAYGELYDRHRAAARRVAAAIAADVAERDDLIAEGFTRVLRILRSGEGPDEDFRPYLLTTIRNTMISWRRRDSAVSLVAEVPDVAPGSGSDEQVGSRLHATVAADAFASLPERWRTVLWRTEIENESPARIAQDLGMTPNGVAALAYRAREGLRQAYLDQHVPTTQRRNCRVVGGQLARWVRDGIGDHKAHRITTHLDHCADCRKLATDLRQLNQELPAVIAPLILGIPLVTPWLSGSVASTGAATGAGVSAGSALSWATAAKVAVAGAALVTTVTIGASTSAVAPPPVPGADAVLPVPTRFSAGVSAPDRPAGGDGQQPGSAAQTTSVPAAAASGTTGEDPEAAEESAGSAPGKPSTKAGKRQNEDKTKAPKTKAPKTSKSPKPEKTEKPQE
jgi:RNA polymerase sigma factor (sigma-70 family)